jgi:hypothetical protein
MKTLLVSALLAALTILMTITEVFAQSSSSATDYSSGQRVIVRSSGETSYRPSGPAPSFDVLDINQDGTISEDEAVGYALLANDFQMADSNRDKRVSRREYERWAARP